MNRLVKTGILLLAAAGCLLFAVGCAAPAATQPETPPGAATQANPGAAEARENRVAAPEPVEPQTRIFTDAQGNDLELPVNVQKVIHLWPASAAVNVFFGTGDKIYGINSAVQGEAWGWMNSACPRLKEITGFASGVSAEELLALEPDVVITSNRDQATDLRAQGVPVICMLGGEDFGSMKEMILKMGELLGPEETAKAEEYIVYLDGVIDTVRAAVANIPEDERVRVYYNSAQMGDSPLLTCGYGSIVQSWMDAVGCINIAENVIQGMDKEINMELIIEADPDYILVGGSYQEKTLNDILTDPAWQSLTAVKEGRVIRNPQGVMKWEKFGVEVALQMLWFTQQIYPGVTDTDIEAAVKDFYGNNYGYRLTEQEYQNLLAGLSSPR